MGKRTGSQRQPWRQVDLFHAGPQGEALPKPRAPRRALMRAVDHGHEDVGCGKPWLAHLVCPHCGHDANWLRFKTKTDAARGLPCPCCNPQTT